MSICQIINKISVLEMIWLLNWTLTFKINIISNRYTKMFHYNILLFSDKDNITIKLRKLQNWRIVLLVAMNPYNKIAILFFFKVPSNSLIILIKICFHLIIYSILIFKTLKIKNQIRRLLVITYYVVSSIKNIFDYLLSYLMRIFYLFSVHNQI